ncbi:hypothetical protein BD410DRAFT_215623 [Rickenella mellea]|uniref:G-protein coupled receptors family 1 profile domain-containing protein n=1 Tax=Rickenella mellea TaxID=50990 RepID=A0A4Y7QKZ4_9AGAM|nr:hypothetical protein BD410DRAFT_215623 [Rickenella mellea]
MVMSIRGSYATPDLQRFTTLWLVLHVFGGLVLLPLVVLSFLLAPKSVPRHPTLINFCISWIVFSIPYVFLIYAHQEGKEDPSFQLCLAQTSMIHGGPPMVSVAGLAMTIQLWCTQRQVNLDHRMWWRYSRRFWMIAPPYIAYLFFALLAMIFGLQHRAKVISQNQLYCNIQDVGFRFIVPSFTAAIMLCILICETAIVVTLLHHRSEVKILWPLHEERRISLSLTLRIALFSMYCCMSLAACMSLLAEPMNPFPYMIQATLPIVAFLVFGTQKDLLRLWCFWKSKGSESPSGSSSIPSARGRTSPQIVEDLESQSPTGERIV